MKRSVSFLLAAIIGTAAAAFGGGSEAARTGARERSSVPPTPVQVATAPLSLAAQVGQKIFFDQTLSGSGKMSCATCHDPNFAYGPPNSLSVQLGGPELTIQGQRAVPSLRYTEFTPPYADLLDNPDGISVPGPGGGYTWDGRAATLAEQASIPLLAPNEMANASAGDVVRKLRRATYTKLFRRAFGNDALSDTDTAFKFALAALQAFQLEDPSFHPYSSKFDLYAGNKIGGELTPAEARGLKLFVDPSGANCASCHYHGAGLNGSSGMFTDFSYEAIGVPRNLAIVANRNPEYADLGLCGPERNDHKPGADGTNRFCGMFKAPSLRNVATRTTFFHNGAIHSLEQAIRFYNTRDTLPELWYPTVGGTPKANPDPSFPTYGLITTQYVGGVVQKFDDLPPAYRGNIDTQLPLDGRARGSAPPMTDAQIVDVICFLKTLTDGYRPSTQTTAGSCAG
jgi:cytochrome c peroxidase